MSSGAEGFGSRQGAPEPAWLDAAPFLARACDALADGQLLHDESFSLFESMTAIEIGDPRMDAGADVGARGLQALLAAGGAPLGLSAGATLAVMDRALAEEASWHAGSFLHQTVFSCLYMLAPDRAAGNVVLSAFCEGLMATVDAVRTLSITGRVCEDEDLLPHAFGLAIDEAEGAKPRMAEGVHCIAALSLAEERLAAGKGCGLGFGAAAAGPMPDTSSAAGACDGPDAAGAGSSTACRDMGASQEAGVPPRTNGAVLRGGKEAPLGSDLVAAFRARLRFQRHFHQALTRFEGGSKQDVDATRKHVLAASAELERVCQSAGLAEGHDVGAAFAARINRGLMAPTPPRTVPALSQEAVWRHYKRLLENLLLVCNVTAVSTWEELQSFLAAFSALQPGPVERSVLHVLLGCKSTLWGSAPWAPRPAMMAAALGLPALPGGALPGPEAVLFVDQAVIAARGWCQAMCLNRPRLRRRLRKTLSDDWRHLYQHAMNADEAPELQAALLGAGWRWTPLQDDGRSDFQGPMATWVERGAAAVQLQDLLLGFQLQLFAPHELCMMYWYTDYLHGILVQNTTHLAETRPEERSPSAGVGAGGDKKSAKAAKAAVQLAAKHRERARALELLEVQSFEAARAMCQAMFRTAVGLQLAGKLLPPQFPYNKEEQRFDQRFAAYFSLTNPAPLDYPQFLEAMDVTDCTAVRLYRLAAASLMKAHQQVVAVLQAGMALGLPDDKVQEMKLLDRVAIQNAFALRILEKAANDGSDSGLKVTFDFPHHPWLAVLVLKG